MAISTCTGLITRGSRVNSGSMKNGLSDCTTKSIHEPGTSTRGRSLTSSTIWLTWAMTMPSRKAADSTKVGVSSVLGPVYRLPWRSAM